METSPKENTITLDEVNRELKRKKSSEVLISLYIEEVELSELDRRNRQHMIQRSGEYRKFHIYYKTAAGRSDSGECRFIRSNLAFTSGVVANGIIDELTYHQLPKSERKVIDMERRQRETSIVFAIVLATFLVTIAIKWISEHVDSPSLFFRYSSEARYLISSAGLLAATYFYINPSPALRGYYYALVGFALAWLAAMLITIR